MNTITTASLTNGSTATASTSTILAIDLGKYKSVACLHDPDSGEFHRRFITAATLVLVLVHLNGPIDHCQAPLACGCGSLFDPRARGGIPGTKAACPHKGCRIRAPMLLAKGEKVSGCRVGLNPFGEPCDRATRLRSSAELCFATDLTS